MKRPFLHEMPTFALPLGYPKKGLKNTFQKVGLWFICDIRGTDEMLSLWDSLLIMNAALVCRRSCYNLIHCKNYSHVFIAFLIFR